MLQHAPHVFPQMCEGTSSNLVTIYVLRIVNCFAVSQAPSKVLHYSSVLVLRLQSQLITTEKLSGADLLRFSRARKCNAAAAVQVSRFSFPRYHNTRTPFNPLFRSCCWKASSGPTKLTCLISAAPGPRLPRRLICVLLGSTWSTGRSYTAACSWSYSRC